MTRTLPAVAVVFAACSSSTPMMMPMDETVPIERAWTGDAVSATLGPDGGTFASADGRLSLEVPPGAVAQPTALSIRELVMPNGSWGWTLGPEGQTFAVPVKAHVSLSAAEAGMLPQRTDAADGGVALTTPSFLGTHRSPMELSNLDFRLEWNAGDTAVHLVAELPHFSDIVVQHHFADTAYTFPRHVSVGQTFDTTLTSPLGDWETKDVYLYCPQRTETLRQLKAQRVRRRLTDYRVEMNNRFVPVGTPMQTEALGHVTFTAQGRCTKPGVGMYVKGARSLEREGGVPWPSGCSVQDVLWINTSLGVTCTSSCVGTDPVDSSLQPGGDASLDLTCVNTGLGNPMGVAWVRSVMVGSWEPGDFYSWFTKVTIRSATAEIGSITREHHDGVDRLIYTGAVNASNSAYIPEASGYLATFSRDLSAQIVSAVVDTGVKKSLSSPFVPDQISIPAFDTTVANPF
jgi:hypothetical protein